MFSSSDLCGCSGSDSGCFLFPNGVVFAASGSTSGSTEPDCSGGGCGCSGVGAEESESAIVEEGSEVEAFFGWIFGKLEERRDFLGVRVLGSGEGIKSPARGDSVSAV